MHNHFLVAARQGRVASWLGPISKVKCNKAGECRKARTCLLPILNELTKSMVASEVALKGLSCHRACALMLQPLYQCKTLICTRDSRNFKLLFRFTHSQVAADTTSMFSSYVHRPGQASKLTGVFVGSNHRVPHNFQSYGTQELLRRRLWSPHPSDRAICVTSELPAPMRELLGCWKKKPSSSSLRTGCHTCGEPL